MGQEQRKLNRRQWLIGMSVLGGVGLLELLGGPHRLGRRAAVAQVTSPSQAIPFFGVHQPGITTPTPAEALVVSFDVTARSRQELRQLFQTLTERIQFLMAGGSLEVRDPKFPPSGSGILGSPFSPDGLTVTVGVGASLFDDRYGLTELRPKRLKPMPRFPNDRLDPTLVHGDLLLQFHANHAETNIHALRDIIKYLSGLVVLRWQMAGFQQPDQLPHPHQTSTRNLLGFKDGTANLDTQDQRLMNELVWVPPHTDEPAWTAGGTYEVVRVIRMFVEFWDRVALEEQEQIFGRTKDTGVPLGYRREEDEPNYARDPHGVQIPLDAHIRLANPRTRETAHSRILRQGFNYSRGFDKAGQLDMGLLFVCYQRDLEQGFEAVQNRLNGEPLEEYIKPIGGGYFFVLPGVPAAGGYLGQGLLG
ncbi:MAG: deferrochelatase/peroxidase EfeB [Synechococcales cyanobacterium M58_A2018_015]|nr:deferrochelatase/peroxidase EfeB [Synechococcales cyanobacterium M58_A2018_015]